MLAECKKIALEERVKLDIIRQKTFEDRGQCFVAAHDHVIDTLIVKIQKAIIDELIKNPNLTNTILHAPKFTGDMNGFHFDFIIYGKNKYGDLYDEYNITREEYWKYAGIDCDPITKVTKILESEKIELNHEYEVYRISW